MKASIGTTLLTSLVNPRVAAEEFIYQEPFVASIVAFFIATFSCAVSQLLICRAAADYSSSAAFVIWIFLVNVMIGIMILVGGLCFLSFFVMLLGGKVNPGGLIWSLALSFSPWMFACLVGIVAAAIGGALGVAVTFPAFTILFFWAIIILVTMVSVSTGLDLLKSSLATVMSFAGAVVLFWVGSLTFGFAGLNLFISLLPPA